MTSKLEALNLKHFDLSKEEMMYVRLHQQVQGVHEVP